MMKEKVIVARPGEEAYVTEIIPSYENLSILVGGPLEMTNPFDDYVAIISDECSKLKGKMPNRMVCGTVGKRYARKGIPVDVYAGTIVIVGCGNGKFVGLSDSEIDRYMNLYKEPQFKASWLGEVSYE